MFNHDKVEHQIYCYTKAIEHDPAMADAYRYRAADYYKINKFQECIADCNTYFDLVKKSGKVSKYVDATIHFRRAEALAMQGKYKEAQSDYDKAVEYVPSIGKYVEGQLRNRKLAAGGK